MEKLGVQYDEEKSKTASTWKACPSCGHSLESQNPPKCPECGTKPFEARPPPPKK